MWYTKVEDCSIHISIEWNCLKDEFDVDGKDKNMLSSVGAGQVFSTDAVDTTCYLVNRSPTSALVEKNPQEVWIGKKPSIKHMKVFGCDAYVHVPK